MVRASTNSGRSPEDVPAAKPIELDQFSAAVQGSAALGTAARTRSADNTIAIPSSSPLLKSVVEGAHLAGERRLRTKRRGPLAGKRERSIGDNASRTRGEDDRALG